MQRRDFLKMSALGLALGLGLSSQAFASSPITMQDVVKAQDAWAKGIEHIGKLYQDGGDYKAAASKMLDDMYAYGKVKVLFKPTKAAHDQFRETKDQAMSYFVGGDNPEDHGFAIQPWSKVRFENNEVIFNPGGKTAEAMGNYYFTDAKTGNEVKVEYTFGYEKFKDGKVKIFLHHSSLPYNPPAH